MKEPTLSACMIVLNMEKSLPACLESIKDVADQIILCIDDATTERTAEIGAEYGAKVSYFKWEDDFSAARNISIKKATCDWTLIIDGDEKLEVEDIPQVKAAMSGDHAAVVFEVLNETSDTGVCRQYAARMFRNGIGAHYIDRVHNQLLVDGARLMPTPPIRLYHYGYNLSSEEREAKSKRTEALLLKQLEARPDYLFAWHNLIRVYRLEERWDELLKAAEKAFDLRCTSRNKHLREMIACDVAFAFMRTGEFEKSKDSLSSWLTLESKNLDAHYYMGAALVGTGDCAGAVSHYLRYLELLEKERTDPEYTSEIMDTYGCEPEVQNALGCCWAKLECYDAAAWAFQRAVDLMDTPKHRRNLQNAKELGDAEVAQQEQIRIQAAGSGSGLRILFVQTLTCIRNYKLAVALKALGHSVSLACGTPLSQTYKLDDDIYDEVIKFASLQHLWYAVETRDYDIIHCMNEPDDLTVAMLNDRVPVIHGTHDLMSLRHKGNRAAAFMEAVANKRSDGRVYTTQLQLEHAAQAYGIDREKSIVIPNYVSEAHVPAVEERKEKLSAKDGKFHIVYQGGISTNPGHHRYYNDLFEALAGNGFIVHVYPVLAVPEDARGHYKSDWFGHVEFHDPVSPAELIHEMTQYDAGIVPFNITDDNRDFLDTCEGNKAREYWAAGIPVIACDTKGMRRVIAEEGPGIIYKTAGDILENLEKLKEMKVGDEHLHTMESVAPKLVEFYDSIIGNSERPLAVEKPEAPYVMTERAIKYHRAQRVEEVRKEMGNAALELATTRPRDIQAFLDEEKLPLRGLGAPLVSEELLKSAFESGIWDAKHCRWHKALNLSTGEPDKTVHYYYNLVNLYALGKLPKGEYLSKYVAAYSWLQSRITKGMIGYTRTVPQKSDPRDQYTLALLPAVLAASELKRAEEAFEKYEQLYGMGRIHNIQASNHIILSALSLWRETGSGSYFDQALGEARWLLNRCRRFGRVFAHSAKMTEASFANHCYGAWAMAEVYKAGQDLLGEEYLAELKTARDSMEWWRAHQGKDGAFPFFLPLADKGRFDPTVYAVHQIGMFLLSAWDINRWSDGKYKDMIDKSIDCVARPEWKHTTEDGLLLYRRSTQQQDVLYAYELGWEILGLSKGGL